MLRRKNPQWDGKKIADVRDKIAGTFEGGRVESFVVDGSFQGSDANDAHIHAAALACGADILLAGDAGFVGDGVDLDLLPYEVYTPDEFFVLADDSAPHLIKAVTRQQTEYWREKKGRAPLAEYLVRGTAAGRVSELGQVHGVYHTIRLTSCESFQFWRNPCLLRLPTAVPVASSVSH